MHDGVLLPIPCTKESFISKWRILVFSWTGNFMATPMYECHQNTRAATLFVKQSYKITVRLHRLSGFGLACMAIFVHLFGAIRSLSWLLNADWANPIGNYIKVFLVLFGGLSSIGRRPNPISQNCYCISTSPLDLSLDPVKQANPVMLASPLLSKVFLTFVINTLIFLLYLGLCYWPNRESSSN